MTREEMLSDLAYARTLAEEGRHAPLVGGSYPVFFGVLLALCYGAQYAILSGALAVPTNTIGLIWAGFGVLATVGSIVLGKRVGALPGGAAISNRVDRAVWQGVVIAILVVVIGTILRHSAGDYGRTPSLRAALVSRHRITPPRLLGRDLASQFRGAFRIVSGLIWFFLGEIWSPDRRPRQRCGSDRAWDHHDPARTQNLGLTCEQVRSHRDR